MTLWLYRIQACNYYDILTASHDGSVKMWDIRSGYSCVATVGKNSSPVLCVDYDDNTSMLAAAGVDGYVSHYQVFAF
jgi:WD40 repeat protein